MSILLIVATYSQEIRRFIGQKKAGIFPRSSLEKGELAKFRTNVQVNAVDPIALKTSSDFEDFVLSRADRAEIVMVMVDSDCRHLTENIRTSIIVEDLVVAECISNPQNYFFGRLARILKSVGYLLPLFKDAASYHALALPLRNFKAGELDAISSVVKDRLSSSDFQENLDKQLKLLRKRVRPRKSSRFKDKYFVDDRNKFFSFGKEEHSKPDTGTGHFPYCEVSAKFRFGVRLIDGRHYNVSEGEGDRTSVSGDFHNCHGIIGTESGKRTHLNMFSSDFY